MKKQVILAMGLAAAVALLSAGPRGASARQFTNLKVLPKGISSKDLQHIMIDEFEDGLGVRCAFCHAGPAGSDKLDYASDAKPEKAIARNMMRMTLKLNARYFQVHRPVLGGAGLVITCTTCHQGRPRPDEEQ
ncbi:MAG TPA: c-type cytochrome [Puia sp.]|nr:c-type cytochrome [Puia sp.]